MDHPNTNRQPNRSPIGCYDTGARLLSDELLDRYLAGEISPSERVAVEQILEASPEMAAFVTELRASQRAVDQAAPSELGRVRELLAERIGFAPNHLSLGTSRANAPTITQLTNRGVSAKEENGSSKAHLPVRRIHQFVPPRNWWYAAAAIFVIGCAGLAFAWRTIRAHWDANKPMMVATYITQNGQRANIVLMDGTRVALDVASRLDVPADYPAGNHTLRLTGEAVFTVAHHDATPFTVVSGGTTTRVLGTSFLVRHYAGDTTTTVAVQEGKVLVHAAAAPTVGSIVLTAAREAEISRTGTLWVGAADPSQFSFVRGVLTYPGGTLQDAIPLLDRWYDADIRLGDPALASQWLTGEFAVGSLADLSEKLAVTFNLRVERVGRVLTLYPR